MIPASNSPVRIRAYLPLPFDEEVYCWVEPAEHEEFFGIPYGYNGTYSTEYVVINFKGDRIKTINTATIAEILFDNADP